MLIFYAQLTIDEGYKILDREKPDRLWKGKQVSACSGWPLYKQILDRGEAVRCWCCGCEADRFVPDRGQFNMQGYPVVNLYGIRNGQLVLMTRDHIIPKSLGGLDDLPNLRPACEVCNGERGNTLTPEELQFRKDHPELWSQQRLDKGKENARRAMAAHPYNDAERERLAEPFKMIGEPL